MFWKIIIEKLFNIKVSKSNELATQSSNDCTDCVRSVARVWQTEMIQQAMFMKNVTHFLNRSYLPWTIKNSPINLKLEDIDDDNQNKNHPKPSTKLNLKSSKELIETNKNDNREYVNVKTNTRRRKFSSKHSILKRNTVDVECECTDLNDEIAAFKTNINILKEKSYTHELEIQKLTKENESLKQKLHNVYKNPWWSSICSRSVGTCSGSYPIESIPKPYEACEENVYVNPIKPVDSEVIITMKNCKNEVLSDIILSSEKEYQRIVCKNFLTLLELQTHFPITSSSQK